jgi:hypothetical protein
MTDGGSTTAGYSAAILAKAVLRLVEDCNNLTVNMPFPLFYRPKRFSVERETTGYVASKLGSLLESPLLQSRRKIAPLSLTQPCED